MLKILVSMLVFASASLVSADTGTTFGDLFYMPNSSEYLFSAKTSLSKGEFKGHRSNGAGAAGDEFTYKKKVTRTDGKLAYSVNDYMQVGVGIDFVYRDHLETVDRRGPTGQIRNAEPEAKNSASFTDPSVFARYRAMNTKDHGFVFDINAAVLVDLDWTKLYKAKRGVVNYNGDATIGNAKKGGSQYTLGLEAGKVIGSLEASFYGNYIYSAKAKTHRQELIPLT